MPKPSKWSTRLNLNSKTYNFVKAFTTKKKAKDFAKSMRKNMNFARIVTRKRIALNPKDIREKGRFAVYSTDR